MNVAAQGIDAADGFPRYFFDIDRLFEEMNDWINARAEVK